MFRGPRGSKPETDTTESRDSDKTLRTRQGDV